MKDFEELGHIFSRLELKKILFYDIFYDNPLTGNRGIGKWQTKDDFKIRLITVQSGVNEKQKTEGLLHLLIPDGYFITAVDSAQYMKPEIRFDNSENLKKAEYTLPLPARLAGQPGRLDRLRRRNRRSLYRGSGRSLAVDDAESGRQTQFVPQ